MYSSKIFVQISIYYAAIISFIAITFDSRGQWSSMAKFPTITLTS